MLKWKDQKRLADAMGISPQFVNDILCRRNRCPVQRAEDMSRAYHDLFGVLVPPHEFVFNRESEYPVFKGGE
jgi:hypothetical protein